ncbi:MAG: tetratricopeptide repeat protein [Bacteroidia bacterium]|jgi:tetratricopeptide (TPR) repeat protein
MDTLKNTFLTTLLTLALVWSTKAQDGLQQAFNNSYALEYLGEYAKAADAIKKVYDEKSYEINMRAGWLHYEAGLYIESQGYYKRAIALNPNSVEARLGYVYPIAALGNMNMVYDQYIKILEIDPLNTTANYRLGLAAYEKKDYKNAFTYFGKVVNIYPFNYDSLIMFAWTNYQLGKTKEAKTLFKKVLLLYPDNLSATEGLSLIK